jgi:hypothetical protein
MNRTQRRLVWAAAILDSRIKAAVICGWAFRVRYGQVSKYCTRMPYAEIARIMSMVPGRRSALRTPDNGR